MIDGHLVTPSVGSGVLRGITKGAIGRLSSSYGFQLVEREIKAAELEKATECFVTSATREVMPVVGIRLEDGRSRDFPPGGGEMTRKVAQAYKDFVRKYVAENAALRLL